MDKPTNMIYKILIGAMIGGAAGFGWYKLVGCSSGACPLTRNPLITITYGAIMGILIARSLH